jgi:cytochrome P450
MALNSSTTSSSLPSPALPQDAQPDGPAPRNKLEAVLVQLQLFFDTFGTVAKRFARFGDVYRIQSNGQALYVFRHPDHIREVLVTQAAAFDKQHTAFQRASLVLGDALLTSDGERWRRQRRLVQPAFAKPRLAEYSRQMVDEAARARDQLLHAGKLDLSRAMNALTLRIVTRTLFGQALEENGETAQAMIDLNRWFATPPIFARFDFRQAARFTRVVATLDGLIERLVEAKRQQLAAASGSAQTAHTDLLSALMAAEDETGERLGPKELRDQLLTLYLAGHETTSHALTWTLYLLSQNPKALAKLRLELLTVLAGRLPTIDDLPALPYTEQVLKESLRLYPPAFLIPRHVNTDVKVGPYSLPSGSEVLIWIYITHRDARWYPEPNQFRPERFEEAEELARPKYAYLPFGAGQRACIGQMFAMIEAQLILATLLQSLDFQYAARKPPSLGLGLTLSPKGGLPMRVKPRD